MRRMRISAFACLCAAWCAACAVAQIAANAPIDRHALVTRHNIVVHDIDPNGAMAVGNGEFAFNFDVTGLQSFPEYYEKTMPIGILSDWGWHSFPNPNGYTLDNFKMETVKKYDREFVYPASSTSKPPPDAAYLRENQNRIGLGRIGLEMTHADGSKMTITDLKNIDQTLDLWAGILTSSFEVDGVAVHVETLVHPDRDEVAIRIESPLIASGRLKVRIGFPYPTRPRLPAAAPTPPTSPARSMGPATSSAPSGLQARPSPRPHRTSSSLQAQPTGSNSLHGSRPIRFLRIRIL